MIFRCLFFTALAFAQALFFSGCLSLSKEHTPGLQAEVAHLPQPDFFMHAPPHKKFFPSQTKAEQWKNLISQYVAHYEKLAEAGDAQKQYELGVMYRYGVLTNAQKTDIDQAIEANVPLYVLSTEKNLDKTKYWMDKAIRNGNTDAIYFYFNFEGDKDLLKHYPTIKQSLKYAASQGNIHAKAALGITYLTSNWGAYEDAEKALKIFRASSELPASQYGLGMMYLTGRALDEEKYRDVQKGVEYLEKASNAGFSAATAMLGSLYLLGKHLPEKPEVGMHYFIEALHKFPFEYTWLSFANHFLFDKNLPELDNVYGDFIKECLLNNAYLDNQDPLVANSALNGISLYGSLNRLGLNTFDTWYFKGYTHAFTQFPSQELTNQSLELYREHLNLVKELQTQADNGNYTDVISLIFFYSRSGIDGVAQKDKALYYAQLAEQNDTNEKNLTMLGLLYLIGIDLPFNEAKGMELLQRADEAGSIYAPLILEEYRVFKNQPTSGRFVLSMNLISKIFINNPLSVVNLLFF